jgi:hypothetical protein
MHGQHELNSGLDRIRAKGKASMHRLARMSHVFGQTSKLESGTEPVARDLCVVHNDGEINNQRVTPSEVLTLRELYLWKRPFCVTG